MLRKTAFGALPAILLLGLLFSPAAQASGDAGMSWGYNYYGELGNGNNTGPEVCEVFHCSRVPVAMAGVSTATQIAASRYHTLALLSDGTVRAWGYGARGQLGDGAATDSAAAVTPSGLSSVVAVAAGDQHSLALLANGTVMAWGNNSSGQLGDGTHTGPEICGASTPCSKVPIPVPGLSDVVAIGAGFGYSVALLSNGTAVAWGWDDYGELGDGTGMSSGCQCVDHPVPVPGLSTAMAISVGAFEASALLADGTIRDWGRNDTGGLGTGATTTGSLCACLGPVAVNGVSGAKAIAAGGFHGMALLADGTVRAWGFNEEGQLGSGSTSSGGCECVPTPAPVSGLSGVQGIAAGNNHSLALLGDGSARSWGDNEAGELGDGTTTGRPAPVAVSGLSGAAAIYAGELNSYALIGAAQALSVSLAGAGEGTVGGPPGILCGSSCSGRYPQGQVEVLRAEPGAGSGFAGFSGACTGTATTCQLRMDQDQSVSATFGPPKGTAITRAKVNSRRGTAKLFFTAPGAITGFECKLIRPKPKKHHKKHKPGSRRRLKKKAKPRFSSCASPRSYKHLRPGRYTFKVRALDILGADEKPAVKKFRIRSPRTKKHKAKH